MRDVNMRLSGMETQSCVFWPDINSTDLTGTNANCQLPLFTLPETLLAAASLRDSQTGRINNDPTKPTPTPKAAQSQVDP